MYQLVIYQYTTCEITCIPNFTFEKNHMLQLTAATAAMAATAAGFVEERECGVGQAIDQGRCQGAFRVKR